MISVECLEGNVPAAKVELSGKHFLSSDDIMHLFNWTLDDVIADKVSLTKTVFWSWLEAGVIYQRNALNPLVFWNRKSSLILTPLEAFVPVETWLVELTEYISSKHPKARINILEIQGVDSLRARARELYPNRV
ncbi:MAG: hypothetical protein UV63_C0006G0008 [Microgenomates group bacterium GW2011_GWC1_43_11]|uniref:Uncharacterized protein n=2 Tax=Candidatus Gottesmaniibacteriota TaxID=1752720 RepID=A0A0G1KWW1_9BACT|nr:MAG: hypothetical protein UV63_C0006G0008 [Microgenomates group bacterium GW2011_GWC1_43_11]KKT38606.1 MAG: hypothetical protein UW22_C0009G0012 [Candidatus Gottesmanbacteria bacterium GW2011_GWB1_44_11c]KKT60797.1 MAG: hypothetical protein UW52_C0017G0008 [Candidatus Gottesmanbacteria bacterium GW2011_GWA1_44_24b]HCM82271.1 hypothetical protein [Patescibacteria group bacterium]